MCDHNSMVARSTCLVAEAGGIALEGGVHFSHEIIIAASAFAPGQILSFWSFSYIASYNGELRHLKDIA